MEVVNGRLARMRPVCGPEAVETHVNGGCERLGGDAGLGASFTSSIHVQSRSVPASNRRRHVGNVARRRLGLRCEVPESRDSPLVAWRRGPVRGKRRGGLRLRGCAAPPRMTTGQRRDAQFQPNVSLSEQTPRSVARDISKGTVPFDISRAMSTVVSRGDLSRMARQRSVRTGKLARSASRAVFSRFRRARSSSHVIWHAGARTRRSHASRGRQADSAVRRGAWFWPNISLRERLPPQQEPVKRRSIVQTRGFRAVFKAAAR